ncbi:MAG TPA: nicotinate (nicotinamide) nucleotide adenylyltransferase [Candidatus Paceibacterota bacterium]
MKIAIYGGSFNPPHTGHQMVAALVLATQDIDELWFMPTHTHMLGKQLLDYEHRFEMCRLMSKMFGNKASVSRAELRMSRQPGFKGSETVQLIRYIQEEFPKDKFRLVMGSDLLDSFVTWGGWAEIIEKAPPIVVHRSGYSTPSPLQFGKSFILPDVSSTEVKKAMLAGENVNSLVPRDVLSYIRENKLYEA